MKEAKPAPHCAADEYRTTAVPPPGRRAISEASSLIIMPDQSQSQTMKNQYWTEIIKREDRPHLYHPGNNVHPDGSWIHPEKVAPRSGREDFYASTWIWLNQKYDGATGVPSALVEMARRWKPEGSRQQQRSTAGVLADAARISGGLSVDSRSPVGTPRPSVPGTPFHPRGAMTPREGLPGTPMVHLSLPPVIGSRPSTGLTPRDYLSARSSNRSSRR